MGRDLDAEIVEKVYGWTLAWTGNDADGKNNCQILTENGNVDWQVKLPPLGKVHKGFLAPRFSEDIREAINLARKVQLPIKLIDIPNSAEELSRMCLEHFKNNNQ